MSMAQRYSFSPDKGETPESLKRKRAILNAMLANSTSGTPRNVGEGIASLGQALSGRIGMAMLDKKENAGRAAAAQMFRDALTGGLAGPVAAAKPATGNVSGAFDSVKGGKFDELAPSVAKRLMSDFGLQPYQAAGVVGNLGHESAGFSTLQEVNPTVPGSRGGFGWAQWTGPRRKQFEAFAAQNGLDPTSEEANYGFLRNELANTPDGSVLGDLRNARTAEEATQVFSDKFLRPGIPNMESRNKWTQRALGSLGDTSALGFSGNDTIQSPQDVSTAAIGVPASNALAKTDRAPQATGAPPMSDLQRLFPGAFRPAPDAGASRLPPGADPSTPILDTSPKKSILAALFGGGGFTPPPSAPMPAQMPAALGNPPVATAQPQAPVNSRDALLQLASDPSFAYLSPIQQQMVMQQIEQELNPLDSEAKRLSVEEQRIKLNALRNPKPEIKVVGDVLVDSTGKVIYQPPADSGGMFTGRSIEGQGLNYLIQQGKLTRDQAAEIAAGKTVTDPATGAIMFLTPSGIMSQMPGQQAQPATPGVTQSTLPQQGAPSVAAPGQQQPTPPSARPGIIPLTGGKVERETETQRNKRANIDQAFKNITTELGRFEELVGQTGIEALPGAAKDNLNSVRQNIMLQMKELFNLGVLNGPDLALMEKMIFDPVIDPSKEGGLANIPGQIGEATFGDPSARAKNSANELRRMLESMRNNAINPQGQSNAPSNAIRWERGPDGRPRRVQ